MITSPFDLRLGVKAYDYSWSTNYGMSARDVAGFLRDIGCTFVIAQSKLLPMQGSAVPNDPAPEVEDVDFREALREASIAYVACLNIGFDATLALAAPARLPIDQHGRPEELEDWYIGLPPTREDNTAHKAGLLDRAVPALKPDGVHFGFVRWPGFWETWLPDVDRASRREYSFDAETVSRFSAETGHRVPDQGAAAARLLTRDLRQSWTEWKCARVVEQIGKLRDVVHRHRPGIPLAVNTLPFETTEFDGAVTEVFGQSVEDMRSVVDVFEVMAYHQILRRGPEWPAAIGSHIASRARPKQAICTVQATPLYLEGMHAGHGRSVAIDAAEFAACLDAVADSGVAGLCVFTLADLLAMRADASGKAKLAALARFAR